jgi:hypothetical protein
MRSDPGGPRRAIVTHHALVDTATTPVKFVRTDVMGIPKPESQVRTWTVRGGRHGENDAWFLENDAVGIGFAEFPDLSGIGSRDEMKVLAVQVMPYEQQRAAFQLCRPGMGPERRV